MRAMHILLLPALALAAHQAQAQVSVSATISGQVVPGVYGQVVIGGVAPGEPVPNSHQQRLMFAQKVLRNLNRGEQLLSRYFLGPPWPVVLARLLEINAIGWAVEC